MSWPTTAVSCLGSVGDAFGLAALDVQTAALHLHSARPDLAIERCAEGIARLPATEHWATGLLLAGQGLGHLLRGELDDGTLAASRGLALEYELGDMGSTAYALGTLGFLAAAQRRYERTGAADRRVGAAVGADRPLVHRHPRAGGAAPDIGTGGAGRPRRGTLLAAARTRRRHAA